MKYKAFISYRHSENGRRHAVALETALKRYAKPTLARPMKIFRDEKHFKPDISLPKLIRDGREHSEYLIFLAEKASAESPSCGQELEQWCNPGKLNRTDRLIIALIDDDFVINDTRDSIDWEKTTALPALLQPYLTSIPLYMDLRWAKSATDTDLQHPKYRHEINALAARLRGVNPEDLNDEEIRVFRRNIRLRNGAIGVLGFLLLVTVVASFIARRLQLATEKEARAAHNALLAIQLERTNPTAAFRIADYNLNAHPENQFALMAYNLILEKLYESPFFHTEYPCGSMVHSVAFSPDGKYVLTGCSNGVAILWSLDGQEIRRFSGDSMHGVSAVFSPDGNYILGNNYYQSTIWNISGEKFRSLLPLKKDDIFWSTAFSSDGKFILTHSPGNLIIWSVDGKPLREIDGKFTEMAIFSPNGQFLLTADGEDGAILRSLEGRKIQTYRVDSLRVSLVAFSPDGNYLLAGCPRDKAVVVWKLNGEKVGTYIQNEGGVSAVAFTQDGKYAVIGSTIGTVCIWNLETRMITKLKRHLDMVNSAAISPNGKYALTGSEDSTAKLWNIDVIGAREIHLSDEYYGPVNIGAFSTDGKMIETNSIYEEDSITVWDLNGQKIRVYKSHIDQVSSVSLSGNRRYEVIKNPEYYKREDLILTSGKQVIWDIPHFNRWSGSYKFCSFSPDGSYLLLADDYSLFLCPAPWTFLEEHTKKLSPQQLQALGARLEPEDY